VVVMALHDLAWLGLALALVVTLSLAAPPWLR
jgi:hypothetical protein